MYSWVNLSHIVDWSGARVRGVFEGQKQVQGVSTDSRTIRPGDVFIALRGEKFDGHHYLEKALEAGAAALICEEASTDLKEIPVLIVSDTLRALTNIAQEMRRCFKGRVIAVTGSAGKSSTKEMIAALLGPQVVASPASFNNLIGVSKTMFLLEDETKYLVLEMGMNALGEIKELCEFFRPHAGLITNIGDAHIGKLGGAEFVYRAKKELFDFLADQPPADFIGVALNRENVLVSKAYQEAFHREVRTISYGRSPKANIVLQGVHLDPSNGHLTGTLCVQDSTWRFQLPIYGEYHAENLASAVAAALLLGEPPAEVQDRLSRIRPADHRGEVYPLKGGGVLIDESYNSNPTALRSSLESLSRMDKEKRRVLFLGDMLELGEFSQAKHYEVGEALGRMMDSFKESAEVVGVGTEVQHLLRGLQNICPTLQVHSVPDVDAALSICTKIVRPGDILFVKSSRGGCLDRLVTHLLALKQLSRSDSA